MAALATTLLSIETVLNLPAMRAAIVELEAEASAPDLWDDQERAQQVTSRLSFVQGEVRRVETLRRRFDDLPILYELADAEDDAGALAEADKELESMQAAIDELEVRTLLSGEYDSREALITIRAEAGGVDAADWAESCCECIRDIASAITGPLRFMRLHTPRKPGSSRPPSRLRRRTLTAPSRLSRARTD
jgi:peptide chain release factor 2